ncbi:MAG TPA: hypothetical protein DDZ81_13595 [Acetobacteraceae bacterium]|nr:hypothetical protein [Acetobacteraceae bacterium]
MGTVPNGGQPEEAPDAPKHCRKMPRMATAPRLSALAKISILMATIPAGSKPADLPRTGIDGCYFA